MKILVDILLLMLISLIGCNDSKENIDNITDRAKSHSSVLNDTIKGDFNGDGQSEYMWFEPPDIIANVQQ
jgi:hypothetical protein